MFTSLMRVLIAALVVVLPAAVQAQAYPAKPIRLIVPFSPGGTNDILARMVGTHLSQTWGESVIVDNRTGADGIIGTEIAVKAKPDGYTLLLVSSAYLSVAKRSAHERSKPAVLCNVRACVLRHDAGGRRRGANTFGARNQRLA